MNATCFPDSCFCEALRSGFVLQPANTISALAFIVVGIYIFFKYRNTIGAIYAGMLVFIGMGTAYYHARLDFVGQTADIFGMYLLVTSVALFSLFRTRVRSLVLYLAVTNIVLLGCILLFPEFRRYIFVGLLLLLLWATIRSGARVKDLLVSLGIMAIGGVVWVFDITGAWCNPDSLLQGHALWHVLGAVASVFLFRAFAPPTEPR